jgi:6-pyruvoyl-tetrahydropterin synthase
LISLTFVADSLRGDDCNFIIDTYDIDAYLDEYFGGSDHCDLEEVFSEPNCSMEWMSKRMYDDLKEKFLKNDIKLYSVTVQETKGSRCTYRK